MIFDVFLHRPITRALLGALVIATAFSGCNPFDGGVTVFPDDNQLSHLDIVDADALAIAGSASTSGSSLSGSTMGGSAMDGSAVNTAQLVKQIASGKFVPVARTDGRGRPVDDLYPLEVKNIDDEWVALFFTTDVFSGLATHSYIVSKSTGRAYALPEGFVISPNYSGYSLIVDDRMYVNVHNWSDFEFSGLYRVTPGENPQAKKVSAGGDMISNWFPPQPVFAASTDGTVIYGAYNSDTMNQRTRAVSATGQVGNLSLTQESLTWTAPDGNAYWLNERKILRPEYNPGTGWTSEEYGEISSSMPPLYPGSVALLISNENQMILVTSDGKITELYDGTSPGTLDYVDITGTWSWNAVSDYAVMNDSYIFLVQGELIPFNPSTFGVDPAITINNGTYEIYSVEPYDTSTLLVSGLDLNNGDRITGRLDVSTGMMTVTDTTSSYQIIQLERIR